MGLSARIWRSLERFMCHCPIVVDAGRSDEFFEVS